MIFRKEMCSNLLLVECLVWEMYCYCVWDIGIDLVMYIFYLGLC